ncbi:hypothetical protein [Blastochloris viridis]|uniref:Uncharacterized protein n=1 Tax=Blastochloris viridis TaxID=1079 RepID=A0A0H5BGT1_BLAVI|nr:hypothetical protein [Blastochloris viridis]ALK09750.1 hypothetical protein BVIR_1980 [Blastochloris viridis]BAS00355.1 hypothetical protein BV133_2761 [Blastochloris viridis]CUU42413.1 hypothetical protein BVIRIDIS_14250 [Blastochloris viridis]
MSASRLLLAMLAAVASLAPASQPAIAETKVRTETIQVPPAGAKPADPKSSDAKRPPSPAGEGAHAVRPDDAKSKDADQTPPAVISDLSLLPAPVARMRSRIVEAAKSGSLERLVTAMQSNEMMPVFSFGDESDPIALWQKTFPDSKGVELLGILVDLMDAPFVHVDQGTPQEMFIWPYFARYPIRQLDPEQMVELFRIVTGSDFREMQEFGAYIFYRVGIAPDGVWHYFVAGE